MHHMYKLKAASDRFPSLGRAYMSFNLAFQKQHISFKLETQNGYFLHVMYFSFVPQKLSVMHVGDHLF